MSDAELKEAELRMAVQDHETVLEAFVIWSGDNPTDIARRAGINRSSVYHCLNESRRSLALRRTLETAYGLPTYALNRIIDGED